MKASFPSSLFACSLTALLLVSSSSLCGCFFGGGDGGGGGGGGGGGDPDPAEMQIECEPGAPPVQPASADILDTWRAERSADQGVEGSFEVTLGESVHLLGATSLQSVDQPATLHVPPTFPSDHPFVYFDGATVDGVGTGMLVLETEQVAIAAGELAAAQVTAIEQADDGTVSVRIGQRHGAGSSTASFPAEWSDAEDGLFHTSALDADVGSLQLDGYLRGVLLTADGAVDVSGPLSVQAEAVRVMAGASVQLPALPTGTLAYDRVALAGDFADGQVRLSDDTGLDAPLAITGIGSLTLSSDRIRSEDGFRVTQAASEEELLIEAEVEIRPARTEVRVERDRAVELPMYYRERTSRGDAVLLGVGVSEAGQPLVQVPIEHGHTLTGELVDRIADSGWAAPVVAFFSTPALITAVFFDVLSCVFGDCPTAYPVWMDAGHVGEFDLRIEGAAEPGTYDVNLCFAGQNHETVQVPLTIIVE